MNNLSLPQHDFFIYIPSPQDRDLHSRIVNDESQISSPPGRFNTLLRLEEWIKVSLAEHLDVYVSPEPGDK